VRSLFAVEYWFSFLTWFLAADLFSLIFLRVELSSDPDSNLDVWAKGVECLLLVSEAIIIS